MHECGHLTPSFSSHFIIDNILEVSTHAKPPTRLF